ncbi:MAG: antibiotic biosynthesis monooxygenase [Gammaproteobacteria bacterium]|nr:antibiotic biosynthesis monooxygenase [Gammaproteobacteria bacterium]
MIIVHGKFPVKHDMRKQAMDMMERMSVASRAEDGCISYEFYVGLTDPDTFMLFQEWESIEALQNHFETDHMEAFLTNLPDILAGEVATRRYEVRLPEDGDSYELMEEPRRADAPSQVRRPKIVH